MSINIEDVISHPKIAGVLQVIEKKLLKHQKQKQQVVNIVDEIKIELNLLLKQVKTCNQKGEIMEGKFNN